VNVDPNKGQMLETELRGVTAKKVTGKALTSAKINDYNSFENPNTVTVKDFKDAKLSNGKLTMSLPAKSIVMLEIE
jgi:alpha-N-arabinofuranosidase